ncbi:inner membrane protease ATP23 [Fusarium oxysporum f. sp. albedinis]|nr:inner membrane protease ATP23 [Fusarium oxysporum f. sp. albedinis]
MHIRFVSINKPAIDNAIDLEYRNTDIICWKIRSGSAAVLSQDKWFIPGILVAVAVPLSYLAPKTVKVIATDRCERILQSIIRRATNWDLDQEGREKLESLAYWLQMVL